jgi:hypothetical protein
LPFRASQTHRLTLIAPPEFQIPGTKEEQEFKNYGSHCR